jgi:hypothetical protein
MSIWHRSDQLKTLAFAFGGWACMACYYAGTMTSVYARVAILTGGMALSSAAIVIALNVSTRPRQRPAREAIERILRPPHE